MTKAGKIVSTFFEALGRGDFAHARNSLHDEFEFQGPIDTFSSPAPFLEALRQLHHIVERVDVKKMFVDGNDVCVLYDMVTRTPAGTAFIAEWYRVAGDKIASMRAVFDARPFVSMRTD
jgi:ketosteroid isomerase-like protein